MGLVSLLDCILRRWSKHYHNIWLGRGRSSYVTPNKPAQAAEPQMENSAAPGSYARGAAAVRSRGIQTMHRCSLIYKGLEWGWNTFKIWL